MVFALCISYIQWMKWELLETEYTNKGERLHITAKEKKEGVNGRTFHLFVATAYGKGVLMCEQFLDIQ